MIATLANYERVFGKQGRRPPAGRTRIAGPAVVRKRDNKDFQSVAMGCAVSQVPDWNRKYGPLGIRFHPDTGNAIIPNRAAKLKMMKMRGMYDMDEVRSPTNA